MKKHIIWILIVGCVVVPLLEAQTTNFFTTVTNLWYQGQKTEVLSMGQDRLNINSNDISGLIIKQAYDEEFLNLTTLSNALINVLSVSATITNVNFQTRYLLLKENNECMLEFLENYFPSQFELEVEKAKGLIPNKPFTYYLELEALQNDGLCEP